MEAILNKYRDAVYFEQFDHALQTLTSDITEINFQNKHGISLTHIAARYNHVDGMKQLIKMGASVNIKTKDGKTCLHLVQKDLASYEIVKVLLDADADPNVVIPPGLSLLGDCCRVDTDTSEFIFWLLLAGAYLGNGLLNQAVGTKLKDMILPLKNRELNLDQQNKEGQTLLHIVVYNNLIQIAAQLLSSDASPNIQDINGNTALHMAMIKKNYNIIQLLLLNGADSKIKNLSGITAHQQTGRDLRIKRLLDNPHVDL